MRGSGFLCSNLKNSGLQGVSLNIGARALVKRLMIVWGLLSASTCIATDLNSVTWMSEQFAPYNWRSEDAPAPEGIFIDLLKEIVGDKLSLDQISFYPWARSYHRLKVQPKTALFSMTDTEERRKLFKLSKAVIPSVVGILCRKSVLVKLKAAGKLPKSYKIGKSLDDASPLPFLKVGVVREDIGDQLIKASSVAPKKVSRVNSFTMLGRKLLHGRLDAIAYNTHVAKWNFKQMEKTYKSFKPSQYELIYVMARKPMTFAFHKQTDPEIIALFNKGLTRLQKSGKLDAIVKKYLD